jgi:MSHA biogenesis protein MshO
MKPPMKFPLKARRQRGFTLVEAVMVIVIVGVIGGMLAVFIQAPVQSYADSLARAELSDTADLALRRIARDLRLALPNSIRVTGDSLEMLMTRTGGRYLSAEDGVDALPVLDFLDPANTSLTVVGQMPRDDQLTPGSDYLVVNNLGPGFPAANAYDVAALPRNIAKVAHVVAHDKLIVLATNPFAAEAPPTIPPTPPSPPSPSPSQRFHIVSGPVTYSCGLEPDGAMRLLTRQSGYPIAPAQLADPVRATGIGQRSLLAGRVRSCQFAYQALASQRSALVILTLELQPRDSTAATVRLVRQVHVDNSP